MVSVHVNYEQSFQFLRKLQNKPLILTVLLQIWEKTFINRHLFWN